MRGALIVSLEPTLDEDVAYGVPPARRHRGTLARRLPLPGSDDCCAGDRPAARHPADSSPAGPFPTAATATTRDELRLIVRTMSWEAYVHLAFDEIRLAGAGSPQVTRRLKAALTDLKSVAPSRSYGDPRPPTRPAHNRSRGGPRRRPRCRARAQSRSRRNRAAASSLDGKPPHHHPAKSQRRASRVAVSPARLAQTLDRLELLERLLAARAVAQGPAGCRPEDVLEPRLGRTAVRAAVSVALQLHERRCAGLPAR